MGRKLSSRPRSRRARRTGVSPYVRHRKTPYPYRATLQRRVYAPRD